MRLNVLKCFPGFLPFIAVLGFGLLLTISVGGLHNPAKAYADQGKNESGKIEGKNREFWGQYIQLCIRKSRVDNIFIYCPQNYPELSELLPELLT